jgi:hypothetical protein
VRITTEARMRTTTPPGSSSATSGSCCTASGDGVAVGAVPGATGLDGGRLALVLSIAAHTVPVTALFVVAFASHRGRRSALARAFGFGLAVAAGIGAVTAVPAWATRPFEPWVTAAVAGLLCT